MNSHYENVFDSIYQVVHDKKDKTTIHTILCGGGKGAEIVPFANQVKAVGNIEDWLGDLLYQQQVTMKDICRNCAADISVASNDIKSLRGFVDNYIAQFALLGIQLMWTSDVQGSLDQCKVKKTVVKECNSKQFAVLSELSSWCLQDLGAKPNRKKIETLVTIHVHQRDVMGEMVSLFRAKKISDGNDFEWLKQARFSWHQEQGDECNEDGASVISVTDVDFNYQYEYLGSKERLVVTPLTDRCYISLAQALGMYFGGAPAGPAGTGKTETVKDMGRTLGIWVVVTNCTDQQSYLDCAKIFKGLCQGGLWGCFDEFNRIQLPVLSVVAQYVLSILNGKKAVAEYFQFPGDPTDIKLLPVCGFFITMNPGYAGRQELPENLKALFRGVVMMVPNFEIIIKVKLCSVGYNEYTMLSKKFFVLYNTNKEQLSAQKHYDWGLRNILSVLRTGGKTKRDNLTAPEDMLMYQTLRDMNLSKLVAQDVPLFLSLLSDLFPTVDFPKSADHPAEKDALDKLVAEDGLTNHADWFLKIIQLYETQLVRHGIMMVGPTCGGKSRCFDLLCRALTGTVGTLHKMLRMNPKAIRAQEMYGEVDPLSGEWTTGCFAAIWTKCNAREMKNIMWIVMDGPVDAIWIEDLNTVLDDNKILTLANGDRIPMSDTAKIMFEVETLKNASPATVSRAGIVYVSDTDLDWKPYLSAWLQSRPDMERDLLTPMTEQYMGECNPTNVGHLMGFVIRECHSVIENSRVGTMTSFCILMAGLIQKGNMASDEATLKNQLERLVIYCITWSVGALLEPEDRMKFHEYLVTICESDNIPECEENETVYEYFVNLETMEWNLWRPPTWSYPQTPKLDFSNLLVPTMDSTRALFLISLLNSPTCNARSVLTCGGSGTAKTSTSYMFLHGLDAHVTMQKIVNFSSATTPGMFQNTVETQLDKRGGKKFGPPNGLKMTFFLDDVSMPLVNTWGDQPTLEAARLIVEQGYFTFLDKDKRGDFKICEDLSWVASMGHPGGGRNDIPHRMKSKFFIFNLVLPSITSINDIYGQMLNGRFTAKEFDSSTMEIVRELTKVTIQLWNKMKQKMLPTPAKFHYNFNMRELSRVFQGVLLTPKETILSGGGILASEGKKSSDGKQTFKVDPKPSHETLIGIWKHECERVFCDKLTDNVDKDWYLKYMDQLIEKDFGEEMAEATSGSNNLNMVTCLREDIYDEEGVFEAFAPKIYEVGGTLDMARDRVLHFMHQHDEEFPQSKFGLVLFNDAMKHLLRISRLVEMPRGSCMLVGVGGSGKQSLTKLAGYISNAFVFQITLTKQYNQASLMEDLRVLYKSAGHQRKPTVFLFTESEIKDEIFLELMNSVLMTGEIAGLIAKDEMLAMCADLRHPFLAERPGVEENPINMRTFFIDNVRDNLHVVLCMSPLNPKFPVRCRKFPGLINAPTVDWFLPWPEEALVTVSRGIIGNFHIECTEETKDALMIHMGNVHRMVTVVCDEYSVSMSRKVYQTPKSYLSFIYKYMESYTLKLKEVEEQEARVNLGLEKLVKGAQDVEDMKVVLAEEQVKLEKATDDTNKVLANLEVSSAEAQKEGDKVAQIADKCKADAERIGNEKAACAADLAKAQPFVDAAETAIDSIKPAHINEIKKLPKPSDIIKLVFDGVLILFKKPLNPVHPETLIVSKKEVPFFEASFQPHALLMMGDTQFLAKIQEFGRVDKDRINEETIEFMLPYLELEGFTPPVAKSASAAAEGLCTWVIAMKSYHEASKIVKPKLEALGIAEAQLEAANKALAAAESRLKACKDKLADLQAVFEAQMTEKKRIEDGAMALARKMQQASDLIGGLSGERIRWTEDSNNFAHVKERLVGDCAIACGFVSYCGAFNQDFRRYLIVEKFYNDCIKRNVPATKDIDIISFLVDVGTIGDWNMEGLPTDPLSIQNGILVTQSSRFPLLCDPQAQAITWISQREEERMPPYGKTSITHPKLKDQLEFAMGEGLAFIVTGIEEEIDPMLDPVMEKQIIVKGKRKSINVSDKNMDYNDNFMMYFITRLPNPHFSPELQAKTTVVDFTVTQKGLEEQLLGRVISKEQHALEEQLDQVLREVNLNTKALLQLDADLLHRLTSNTGNLLEDEELIGVLANTKQKAAEVSEKLVSADETKKNINEKREQFRPVATRGAVLYFAIVEMSLVNCMYQTALEQFLGKFMASMDLAEKAALASKRVENIIDTMTYNTYRYINRGLYEEDKLLFMLLVTLKVLVTAGHLSSGDVTLFLRGGAALDVHSVRRMPFKWMTEEAWLNVMQLSMSNRFFAQLPNDMTGNEGMWRRWYEDNEPESMAIPDYDQRLLDQQEIGPFLRLLIIRSLRVDRTTLACSSFIEKTREIGPRYVEPVTDTIQSIYEESVKDIPIIFLLSPGADPTEAIDTLARKRKMPSPATVSLGQGQEPIAMKAMNAAAVNGGTWVVLQNCELGLLLMNQMEDYLSNLDKDDNFRLYLSCLPSKEFPLGLLQMSTKVTNEPPAGMKAGLLRSYTVQVDQDRLERVESLQWRQLLFALCFLHSTVQERRKFGSLGWCIPYEFNTGDLEACLKFLEKHLYNGPISWPTLKYMVHAVQYGGRITDNVDRRTFKNYAESWVCQAVCEDTWMYNPTEPINRIPNDFVYRICSSEQIDDYHKFCTEFPEIDSPEIYGLHPNADISYRVKQATGLLNQMGETQPKGGSGGGGEKSPSEIVYEKAEELLERVPEDYVEDDYKLKIKKLGGLTVPLNIFLFQEIQRLQSVIMTVRTMLLSLQQAIRGEVVMTEQLQGALQSMYEAKAPTPWVYTVAGDEYSWILPTLGLWFTSFLARNEQNYTWLTTTRPVSNWLTGFFNPQGILTAMKQEVTRRHKQDAWALDDVVYHTDVTPISDFAHVKAPPQEGFYVHGLSLDGAAFNKHDRKLIEQEPKKLFVDLPVLWVSANTKSEQAKVDRQLFTPAPYEAPVYKYTARTDRFFVFFANLRCDMEKNNVFWSLRGVALLCNTA
jgi:dynein heavy chain